MFNYNVVYKRIFDIILIKFIRGEYMAVSKKIVIDKENINVIKTTYNENFINNINRAGRKKHNFEILSDEKFKKCLNQKIKTLKDYNKKLDYIKENNEFNVFLTIRGINKYKLKKILDRIRKADSRLSYVTLASWSIEIDLHYHILLNTSLSQEQLESKVEELDSNIQEIYYSKKLYQYLKKNINFDTMHILRQVDNKELKYKQIEILEYSKILSYSKDIKHKPIVIKNPSQEQLQEIYNNSEYIETIEYENLDSKIQIDKFER